MKPFLTKPPCASRDTAPLSAPSIRTSTNTNTLIAIAAAAALTTPAAQAQNSNADTILQGITVTGSRIALPKQAAVADVQIIDQATIAASAAQDLPELLRRLAGAVQSSSGGPGQQGSLFLRGANAKHTLLLIDGVRISSATTGSANWANLPLAAIQRIEILRGPASALYGSDAVGGVVQIFTTTPEQNKRPQSTQPSLALSAGKGYYSAASQIQGETGPFHYNLGLEKKRDRAFSASNEKAPSYVYAPDADAFSQQNWNASIAGKVGENWRIGASANQSKGRNHWDDGRADLDTQSALRNQSSRAWAETELRPGWTSTLSAGQSKDSNSPSNTSYPPSSIASSQTQWTWQNTIRTDAGTVLAGLERNTQKVNSSTAYAQTERHTNAAFLGWNGESGIHHWQANLRRDKNSQYGAHNTGNLAYSVDIDPAWRLNAALGNSFVAPTFNELYYPGYANPTLRPERGRSAEFGLQWNTGPHTLKLNTYRNKVRDLVTLDSNFIPQNTDSATLSGYELSYSASLGKFDLEAKLGLHNPKNDQSGETLVRRPKQEASTTLQYRNGPWTVAADAQHIGKRSDQASINFETQRVTLPAYTLLNTSLGYDWDNNWQIQASLNNLSNKKYETVYGYNQAGRTARITLRYQPKE